jgi:two-component sensor histidine kinase
MSETPDAVEGLPDALAAHLANLADNLQLVADLGYGDVTLAVPEADGALRVVADARPATAVTVRPTSRAGETLDPADDPEAYEASGSGETVGPTRTRTTRGIAFSSVAHPVGSATPHPVLVRETTEQVAEAPGKMERVWMEVANGLVDLLLEGPLLDASGEPFATVRRAGDGVLRLDEAGLVTYASPNAMNILGSAGSSGSVVGTAAAELPGGSVAIAPALRAGACSRAEVTSGERMLEYRILALAEGSFVLVQDVTEARRQQQELKVKEATIREVHHRVKNNLQTIGSLLRIQSRRSEDDRLVRALAEADERISAMAVVHEMLASSTDERVDLSEAARTVVDMVRQGLVGRDADIGVTVEGESGLVPASAATSLALVIAELVHNAIEHGVSERARGSVTVGIRRLPGELHLVVRDDGGGLPDGFSPETSANLGLAIVRTVVQDDLGGTLAFGEGRGTVVTIRIPLSDEEG